MANKNKQSNDKIYTKLTETNKKNTQLGENFSPKMVKSEKKNNTNKPENKDVKFIDGVKKFTKDKR